MGVLQRRGPCLTELCELAQAPSPVSALVRLLQYYASWAQLRDALLPDWTPRGARRALSLLLSPPSPKESVSPYIAPFWFTVEC